MKEGWRIEKLKDACLVFADGDWIETKNQSPEGIRLVQTGNIGFGFFKNKEDKSRFISEETFNELKCTEVLPGDLLVSRLPDPVGKSCIIPDLKIKMITGVDCTIIRLKDYLISEYLAFYQMSNQYLKDVQSRVTGTTRSRISRKNLGLIEIPIPPLPEQKQIVALLDKAFAAIDQVQANIEKNIGNAKELFQSKLNEIFSQQGDGWEEKKLNEICEVKDGTHDSPKYVDEKGGIPFVTQKNILDEGLSFESTKFISESDHESFYKRSNVAFEDILFAMIGANRGMACIVDDKRTFSIKNVGLIKSNESYRPKYLLYYLKSPLAKKYVDENSSGSAQGFIGLGKLRAFPIPYTGIETQEKIESQIESLNECIVATISAYHQKLANLEELKKSILQMAFSGALTSTRSAIIQKPLEV
jgi:type I restriction enzyme S subunit